jgi:hypothetical protein
MNSFTCDRAVALQIAEYQENKHHGFGSESQDVINYIKDQPEQFGYESVMCRIPDFQAQKLHGFAGRFVRPFMIRMKAYKRGKDWITGI